MSDGLSHADDEVQVSGGTESVRGVIEDGAADQTWKGIVRTWVQYTEG
jgi:hypothetical protein